MKYRTGTPQRSLAPGRGVDRPGTNPGLGVLTMAAAMVNGGPSAEGNPSGMTMAGTGKQQPKPATGASSKSSDGNRKQAGNLHDGVQK